jgi:hypothetical protein
VDTTDEGGVGFHDLQKLLKPVDRVDDELEAPALDIMESVITSDDQEKGKSGPRLLHVKVERARAYTNKYNCCYDINTTIFLVRDTIFYPNMEVPEYSPNKKFALGHAFLDWGGFATLQPMFGSKSPYNSNQEDIPIDNEGMRKVLNKAAQITHRPDPSFETPKVPNPMEVDTKEEELAIERPAPAQQHSQSWTLPSPPPDSSTTKLPPKQTKNRRSSEAKASSAGITVRQQQILAKAKQTQPPAGEKRQSTGGKRSSKDKGDAQNQEWTTSKKESRNRLEESAKPGHGLKERLWSVVGQWF